MKLLQLYKPSPKDERQLQVENIGYRYGYMFISYSLLLITIYRGIVKNEAAWDLLSLVILSGLVMSIYQMKQKTIDFNYKKKTIITTAISLILAILISFIMYYII